MTIHRRTFVQAATALAVGAAGTRVAQAQAPAPAQLMPTAPAAAGTMTALPDLSSLDPKAPPPPKPDGVPAPTMKRFQEQRWVLDNIIRANGIDWDQPRLPGLAAALGPEATNDITAIRSRVQKFADITPAFEAVARRRETRAIEAQNAGDLVGARDNYFMAANYWGGAQWPIDENNDKNIFFNQKKRECYLKYAKVADHRVEPAWIAIEGKTVPAWFLALRTAFASVTRCATESRRPYACVGTGRFVPVVSLFATGRPWNRRHRRAAESLLGSQSNALRRRPDGIRAYASLAARGWRRHTNFRLHPDCLFFRDCLPSILRFRPT